MASQEMLDQLGDSSSTSNAGDASTSSEDENSMAVSKPMKMDNNAVKEDPMEIDTPTSTPKPKPKVRIKLTLRPSITPNDNAAVAAMGAVAAAEAINGIKKEAVNGTSEVKDKSPQVLVVKQEPNVRSSPPPPQAAEAKPTKPFVEKPSKSSSPGAVKVGAKEGAGPPSTNAKKSPQAKQGASKPKKTEGKTKVKKESKVKAESGTGSNGTSKVFSTATGSSGPPKKKMKKKLPKLPLSTKRKLPLKGASLASEEKTESSGSAVKATVVDSSEVVEEDAVAVAVAVVEGGSTAGASGAVKAAAKAAPAEKKRQQAKPIRLPPMTSPGLLISHLAAGTYRSAVDSSGFAKPETVFEQSMAMAGYTTEGRTKEPHRGSSVKRVVGDMFDSDVGFALNFPKLVPKDLWETPSNRTEDKVKSETSGEFASQAPKTSLPLMLINSLKKGAKSCRIRAQDDLSANGKDGSSRKRQRPWEFREMIPVSLTLPYPTSFVEKRLKYVKEVDEREQAIVAYQEAQEKLGIEQEQKEFLYGKEEGAEKPKIENPVKIPPIPTPPSPPPLSEFKGLDIEQFEDKHPLFFPKGKQNFVKHLDKDCFHITEGRYFGLSTNAVADPHFVGANAPGIAGLPVSCGSGLATSSTSSGTGTLVKSDSVLAVPPSNAKASEKSEKTTFEKSSSKKEGSTAKSTKKTASLPIVKSGSKTKFKLKHVGPTPTANASDLRKLMEEGGEMAEKTKQCIIRAAVHASRSGKHGQSFLAPDGRAYPDVSKAFAAHAGLKPCSRCKNNKQGAYHCRLRRKHKELDHDGSNSPADLAPLLLVPMEDLLIQPKASTST